MALEIDGERMVQKLADRIRELELDNAMLKTLVDMYEERLAVGEGPGPPALRPVDDENGDN